MIGLLDIVIVGSGMGGVSFVVGFVLFGVWIMILECGYQILDNVLVCDFWWIYINSVFCFNEIWIDGDGLEFELGNYYNVGGNLKFYGVVLICYCVEDFDVLEYEDGIFFVWLI